MKRIHTTTLTTEQKKEITALVDICRHKESLTLSVPLEDGLEYFLFYDNGQLLSVLFLFFPEQTTCECGAFTNPSFRQNGYFSALLEDAVDFIEACEEASNLQIDLCFLSDGHSSSAKAALQAIGAVYWYSEYGMERLLSSSDSSFHSHLSIKDAGEDLYTASLDDQLIGISMIIPSGDSVYFYGFEIKEPYRGKGHGQTFLLGMLALLAQNYLRISLQVSSQNSAALSLYQKTGFRITETLSYYLY